MSDQFTTTFVPKKPITQQPEEGKKSISRPVGFLSTIVTILFFCTLLIAGGTYFWKQLQKGKMVRLQESVAAVEKTLEPQLITELQMLDKQLDNGNLVLKNHTVVSPVFSLLETSTLPQVRFTRFEMLFDEAKGPVVKMSGEADGYRYIAQQSDVLSTHTFIRDMIFSNFTLTAAGRVSFDVSFGVRPEFVDFEKAPLTTSVTDTSSL